MELPNSTVSLLGLVFSNVLIATDIDTLRNNHATGLALVAELRRHGFNVTRIQSPLTFQPAELLFHRSRTGPAVVPDDPDPTAELLSLRLPRD